MDYPQGKSVAHKPQDHGRDRDLCQNATQLVPTDAARRAPRPPRTLLADHIDRQFPLIRSA